jgi:hypothetical protein
LVAEAFIPNLRGLPMVNHIDGNGLNNRIDNLEWVSPSANTQHAHDTGLARGMSGTSNPSAKLAEDDVRTIRRMISERRHSQKAIARMFGVCDMVIAKIKKGITWSHVSDSPGDSSLLPRQNGTPLGVSKRGDRKNGPNGGLESTPGEEWRPVVGYEGYFSVSNMGRIRSETRTVPHGRHGKVTYTGKALKPTEARGYSQIQLHRGDEGRMVKVHRLVAEAFVPNPRGLPIVNHIDGNGLNNRADNLEWVSPSENTQHAHDTGLAKAKAGEDHPSAKLTEDDVRTIRRMISERSHSQAAIARMFRVCEMVITDIKKRRTWKDLV